MPQSAASGASLREAPELPCGSGGGVPPPLLRGDAALGLAEYASGGHRPPEPVAPHHERFRRLVVHLPEGDDRAGRAREHESADEAGGPLGPAAPRAVSQAARTTRSAGTAIVERSSVVGKPPEGARRESASSLDPGGAVGLAPRVRTPSPAGGAVSLRRRTIVPEGTQAISRSGSSSANGTPASRTRGSRTAPGQRTLKESFRAGESRTTPEQSRSDANSNSKTPPAGSRNPERSRRPPLASYSTASGAYDSPDPRTR